MNGRITTMLVFVFLLAVGVSLGGSMLIMESRENAVKTAEVENLSAEVERLKSDLVMQGERLDYLEEIGKRMQELPPEQTRDTSAPATAESGDVTGILERLPKDDNLRAALAELSREQAKVALKQEREAEEEARRIEHEERMKEWAERTKKRLEETYSEHLKVLVKELELNAYQEGDIKAALDERREGIQKLYSQRGRDRDENSGDRVSWDDINKKYQEQLAQILTESQMKIYTDKRLDRTFSSGGWGRGRGRGPGR